LNLAECIRIYSRPNAFFLEKGLRKHKKHYSLQLFYNKIMEHCIFDAVWNDVTLASALADTPAPSWKAHPAPRESLEILLCGVLVVLAKYI